jgi:hypothetical protein
VNPHANVAINLGNAFNAVASPPRTPAGQPISYQGNGAPQRGMAPMNNGGNHHPPVGRQLNFDENMAGGKKRRTTKLSGKMVRAVGSRVQVWNGTAHHTAGGLQRKDLMMSHGRIVSKKRHELGKKNKTFKKLTALTKRGKFKLITKSEAKKALAK